MNCSIYFSDFLTQQQKQNPSRSVREDERKPCSYKAYCKSAHSRETGKGLHLETMAEGTYDKRLPECMHLTKRPVIPVELELASETIKEVVLCF